MIDPMATETFSCAVETLKLNHPLTGTVGTFSYLFLIEYVAPFPAKAIGESTLPPELKAHIKVGQDKLKEQGTPARTWLIRNQQTNEGDELRLYVIRMGIDKPDVHYLTFEKYEQITYSPFDKLAKKPGGTKVDKPIYLVCTNGNRDACCSKFGFPIYKKLYQEIPNPDEHVWQCSHVGGHRFAANMVTLPYGHYYGQVEEKDLSSIDSHSKKHEVYLNKYRGTAPYKPYQQVALAHIMKETGDLQPSSFSILSEAAYDSTVELSFLHTETFSSHIVAVQSKEVPIIKGCAAPEPTAGTVWEVI